MDFPIKIGDFPVRYVSHYQAGYYKQRLMQLLAWLQGAAMGLDPSQLADFENLSPEELQKEAVDHQTWLGG